MAGKTVIRLTANFERNLETIADFLLAAQIPQRFDALLDELIGTVIPNLERFPQMGRPFYERTIGSVEVRNAFDTLQKKLQAVAKEGEIREYLLTDHLILYVLHDGVIDLLSIRHHRQLSFDVNSLG